MFPDDPFEGFVLDLGDVKIKIQNVDIDQDSIQIDFKLKVSDRLEDETEAALNVFNALVDGPVGGGNPRINFNDETPGSPKTTSDTFRLEYTGGSGIDFIDI